MKLSSRVLTPNMRIVGRHKDDIILYFFLIELNSFTTVENNVNSHIVYLIEHGTAFNIIIYHFISIINWCFCFFLSGVQSYKQESQVFIIKILCRNNSSIIPTLLQVCCNPQYYYILNIIIIIIIINIKKYRTCDVDIEDHVYIVTNIT